MNRRLLSSLLLLLLIFLFWLGMKTGSAPLSVIAAFKQLFSGNPGIESLILFEVRFPRVMLALIMGAALGLSGAVLQGMLRSPLAEPGLLGVANGAAFGGVLALYFGLSAHYLLMLPAMGAPGAGLATLTIFLLAGNNTTATTIILAGVAINSVFSSLIAMTMNYAPNPHAVSEIATWLLGSVANKTLSEFYFAGSIATIGMIMLQSRASFLDALTIGEDTAASLGFDINRERIILGVGIALAVGASVAVVGAVGFVGLIIPNLLRPLVKHSPSALLLVSALGGASLLLFADILVQVTSPSQELKIGAVTALLGGPFLFYLIMNNRRDLDA
jgi:iron complex transport system permease protein